MNPRGRYEVALKEDTHEYFFEGKRVPGVSEILKATKQSKDYNGVDSFYRDRGIAVHLAIKYYLNGVLDEESIDNVIRPYFVQWKEWWQKYRKEFGEIIACEVPLFSKEYGFAGTVDLITEKMTWDWKCSKSAPDPGYFLQGAAYQILVDENFGLKMPFQLVKLTGEGEPEFPKMKETPKEVWKSVVNLYQWGVS